MDAGMTAAPGSIGEEAAKLIEALGMWARGAAGAGTEAPGPAGTPTGETAGGSSTSGGWSAEDLHAAFRRVTGEAAAGPSIADGSPACRLCPVCQLIAVLRHARPETFAHLLDASAALTAALRSVVEQAESAHPARPPGVQRIDLDPPGRAAGSA
jgi:hypothetical protein